MSSEDEFFDAPEAIGCGRTWAFSDNDEDSEYFNYDFEKKNARRRSRVESLKKKHSLEHSLSKNNHSKAHLVKEKPPWVEKSLDGGSQYSFPSDRRFVDDTKVCNKSNFPPKTRCKSSQIDNFCEHDENHFPSINFQGKTYFDKSFKVSKPSIFSDSELHHPSNDANAYSRTSSKFHHALNDTNKMHNKIRDRGGNIKTHEDEVDNLAQELRTLCILPPNSKVMSSLPEVFNERVANYRKKDSVKYWSLNSAKDKLIVTNTDLSLGHLQNQIKSNSLINTINDDNISTDNDADSRSNNITDLRLETTNNYGDNNYNSPYSVQNNPITFYDPYTVNKNLKLINVAGSKQDSHNFNMIDPSLVDNYNLWINKIIQTKLSSNYMDRLTLPPISKKKDNNDATLCNEKTMKSKSNTLENDTILNPIELQFRDRLNSFSLNSSEFENRIQGRLDNDITSNILMKVNVLQKRFKNAVSAVKTATKHKIFSSDEQSSDEDEEVIGNQGIRLRSSRQARGRRQFLNIKLVQEMKNEHVGAIWAMRFSSCGRLLASAGHDRNIRIWVLKQWQDYFMEMQDTSVPPTSSPSSDKRINTDTNLTTTFGMTNPNTNSSYRATASGVNSADLTDRFDSFSLLSNSISSSGKTDDDNLSSSSSVAEFSSDPDRIPRSTSPAKLQTPVPVQNALNRKHSSSRFVFSSKPLLVLRGHEAVVTDLTWSKNLFLLATSMDHKVRLWHVSRCECLCVFGHIDVVPTVVFHPKDDRYFLSGSLDGKLRLWNIPDKKVRFSVEVPHQNNIFSTLSATGPSFSLIHRYGARPISSITVESRASGSKSSSFGCSNPTVGHKTVITCATFACESTKVVVGTYDGRVLFYDSELNYITFIAMNPSEITEKQCRVTAIECDPTDSNKILVASNDSRLRLIDARDYRTLCKYRGFVNHTSQIRASFSPGGRYLISGSENSFFYIWQKSLDVDHVSRFSRIRKDRNNRWEAIKAHDTMVTVALFAPNPNLILDKRLKRFKYSHRSPSKSFLDLNADPNAQPCTYHGDVVVSADCSGCIRVFKNLAPDAKPSAKK